MKKHWKQALFGGSAALLLAGVVALPTIATVGEKTAVLHYQNMKIKLNGQVLDLRDGAGNPVEPFIIDGTTYLPVAVVGKALGMNVGWDNESKTVSLDSTGGQAPAPQTPQTPQTGDIGVEKAKSIALGHAGVAADQVVFVKAEKDFDDGRVVYEVEFYSNNKEYDYEIDAATGAVISYDFDAEGYAPPAQNAGTSYIGEAKAKQIVEKKAGGTGVYKSFKLDRDDGRAVYEGELRIGAVEYDFEIDATSGAVLKWEMDRD